MKPLRKNQPQRNTAALTLIEVLVVIAVMGILVVLFIPAISRPPGAMRVRCDNNLKQVGLAFRLWANDNGDKFQMSVSTTNGGTMELLSRGNVFPHYLVMSNELGNTPKIVVCPDDSTRTAATNFGADFRDNKISYFVGLDADLNQPNVLLAGDSNFEIGGVPVKSGLLEFSSNAPISWTAARHKFQGNIALADGSVQQVSSRGLRQLTSLATNRLLLP